MVKGPDRFRCTAPSGPLSLASCDSGPGLDPANFGYFEDEAGRRSAAKLLSKDEPGRIAINIAEAARFTFEARKPRPRLIVTPPAQLGTLAGLGYRAGNSYVSIPAAPVARAGNIPIAMCGRGHYIGFRVRNVRESPNVDFYHRQRLCPGVGG